MENEAYLEANKKLWNERTQHHIGSAFYDNESFLKGKSSLKNIELELLGDIKGKKILHLQCHFGQDTLSMSRMGAKTTGVDLSDEAIEQARKMNTELGLDATFICSDVYRLKENLDEKFDMVFTSYGTIGWLPDLDKWADVIRHFLKPGGELIFVEFHPVVWMFDNDFKEVGYSYFNTGPIIEEESGTYTDRDAPIKSVSYGWNHNLAEVFTALLNQGLELVTFKEYDYSPYTCFSHLVKEKEDVYYVEHLGKRIPMVYALKAIKKDQE